MKAHRSLQCTIIMDRDSHKQAGYRTLETNPRQAQTAMAKKHALPKRKHMLKQLRECYFGTNAILVAVSHSDAPRSLRNCWVFAFVNISAIEHQPSISASFSCRNNFHSRAGFFFSAFLQQQVLGILQLTKHNVVQLTKHKTLCANNFLQLTKHNFASMFAHTTVCTAKFAQHNRPC